MSNFKVDIVQLGACGKHPNADSLGITQVYGQNCIYNLSGNWKEGDLAVYVPAESVVPLDRDCFKWLAKRPEDKLYRVKPIRLRGIYSEGFLVRPEEALPGLSMYAAGQDVTADLGIIKYEEADEHLMATDNEKDPGFIPHYDMESYFKYKHLLVDGEDVIATEKIHGCNSRFCYANDRLWVGSHGRFKKMDPNSTWWKMAIKLDLETKLKMFPGIAFYGEVYGHGIQDLKYSVPAGETIRLRFFDAYDTVNKQWVGYLTTTEMVEAMGLEMVPVIYRGPLDRSVVEPLRTGLSVLDNKTIREGIVLRAVNSRWNQETGRAVFKLVSEEYKLRKNGTERK